ncbi:MAG: hypothetical protein F4Y01_14530, partial [Gammaproteobacteria bacterium]|nr:hypothetical protein [Gammaproteobacteria bacterium]
MKDSFDIASNQALRSLRRLGAAAFARAFRERKQTDTEVAALAAEGIFEDAAALLDAHMKALDSFADYLDEWDDAIREEMERGMEEGAYTL